MLQYSLWLKNKQIFFLFHLSIKTIHIQLIRKHTAAVMSIDFPYAW